MSENAEAAAAELGSISISTTDDEPDVDDDDDANTRLVASVVTKMSETKKIRMWFIVAMMILSIIIIVGGVEYCRSFIDASSSLLAFLLALHLFACTISRFWIWISKGFSLRRI
mgnify:CR=1 FL=1